MSLRVYGFSGPVVMTLKYYHLLNYSNDIEIGILMVSDIAQNISRNSARERERENGAGEMCISIMFEEEMCILLNDAWELLSDPEKRKDYDAQIELQP